MTFQTVKEVGLTSESKWQWVEDQTFMEKIKLCGIQPEAVGNSKICQMSSAAMLFINLHKKVKKFSPKKSY